MSVPTQRRTKSYKKRRASHFALKKVNLSVCPKCKKPILPHHVCSFCGTYNNKEVLNIKIKGKKTKSKEKSKEKGKGKEKKSEE